ncbi:MAG: hypothetical protein HY657_12165 [Acidobacteria bacterium]|nr:hypothetical protein [Acidobacteriota bacterium]
MKVRLTRRLAECVDGIDLSRRGVGDVLDLSEREARTLVAEGWAVPLESRHRTPRVRREAADAARRTQKPRSTRRR